MNLIWCPETASKSYIDTVKSCENIQESSVAELISGTAGGWRPQFTVETWCHGGVISTSIGLSIASRHTGARYVCIVPDELSRSEYTEAMQKILSVSSSSLPEIIVGEPEDVMNGLVGVDFMVVDCRRKDFFKTLKFAKLSQRGAVLICKNVNSRSNFGVFRWRNVLNCTSRVVRTAYLPVRDKMNLPRIDIAHLAASTNSNSSTVSGPSRWIRHIDHQSGEECIIRR
ncbi:hypothetical protein MKX01_031380 [Papaver californicum]|nr:hypothetical protein MKX01_031380 [Papaver californicum]